MTTHTPAQDAAITAPDPVFSSDGLSVELYDGALALKLLPGCSADRDDDQPSIYGGFVPLTVELAQAILKNQNTNRSVSDAAVARYADDMKNANWEVTSQGIQLDLDGRNQDGQHRLNARIAAAESDEDTPDPIIWISMGYARRAMLVVDSGLKRRATASAKIAGLKLRPGVAETEIASAHESLIVAMMTQWDRKGKAPNLSNHEKISGIQRFADAIEWVTDRENSVSYLTNTAVRGVLASAYVEHKGSLEKLVKLEQFKRLVDIPYYVKGTEKQEEPVCSEIHDLSTTDYWPAMVRKFIDDGKKAKKAGAAFRTEVGKRVGAAVFNFINGEATPMTKDGRPTFKIQTSANSKVYYVYDNSPPCHDNTWDQVLASA